MLLKDNEEKRNIAWRTVMTVTSVLIILIAIFFAVKLFTSNPLAGNWENTDDGMKLKIKNNGAMTIIQTLECTTNRSVSENYNWYKRRDGDTFQFFENIYKGEITE